MKLWIAFLTFSSLSLSAIDFPLLTLSRQKKLLSDYLNSKPVLLVFWATWCGPCLEELRELKKADPSRFTILAINIDSAETASQIPAVVRRYSIPFEIFVDPNTDLLGRFYLPKEVPYSVLFSKNGEKLAEFVGATPDLVSQVEAKGIGPR